MIERQYSYLAPCMYSLSLSLSLSLTHTHTHTHVHEYMSGEIMTRDGDVDIADCGYGRMNRFALKGERR